jgi:hypothetical protein
MIKNKKYRLYIKKQVKNTISRTNPEVVKVQTKYSHRPQHRRCCPSKGNAYSVFIVSHFVSTGINPGVIHRLRLRRNATSLLSLLNLPIRFVIEPSLIYTMHGLCIPRWELTDRDECPGIKAALLIFCSIEMKP